jgi:hypothetical protein
LAQGVVLATQAPLVLQAMLKTALLQVAPPQANPAG